MSDDVATIVAAEAERRGQRYREPRAPPRAATRGYEVFVDWVESWILTLRVARNEHLTS
jgi:hypothetical protein